MKDCPLLGVHVNDDSLEIDVHALLDEVYSLLT
jgi:hypothetical protein